MVINMKLDIRLRMVAGLVRPGKPLVDVGTDHAYLPAFLVENGIISSAKACDIKVGPLNNAKKTIESLCLEDKIEAILSDGLIAIPREETDFSIAGMGGELIASILETSPWVKQKGNHFVLQPQSHPEDLRAFLFSNGYEILNEDVVKDKRHLYLAMEVIYTGEIKEFTKAETYVGKLTESKSIYKDEYIEYVIKRLETQYAANHRKELLELIDKIKKLVIESSNK